MRAAISSKWLRRTALALAMTWLVAQPGLAHASNYACTGPVSYLSVSAGNTVFVNIGHGVWAICNLQDPLTSGGTTVQPASCRAWFALLTAARVQERSVAIYFASGGGCNALGTWVVPVPAPYHLDG